MRQDVKNVERYDGVGVVKVNNTRAQPRCVVKVDLSISKRAGVSGEGITLWSDGQGRFK